MLALFRHLKERDPHNFAIAERVEEIAYGGTATKTFGTFRSRHLCSYTGGARFVVSPHGLSRLESREVALHSILYGL